MRTKNKENLIILPNGDECPAGKIKDESKLLNLVSAEYGIAEDISYFHLQKQKNKYLLKLLFIPCQTGDLHTDNAKKFVIFELIKNGINCTIRIDEDLNKRAATILDLVNNTDPNSRETVRANLSAILDVQNELEQTADLLLADAQFNSFKYSVLNKKKMTSLLCVNSHGIYMRALESPFDEQDCILWSDIKNITCKQKKLFIHKKDEQISEITCLNSKMARVANVHLCKYLAFKGVTSIPVTPNIFVRISLRIRKSFSRRSSARPSTIQNASSPVSEKPVSTKPMQIQSQAPSTIPESSFISEDVMDNPVSMVEPSLKTNSTYDVSLGSDNSYRPTITSLSIEELSHNADKLSSFQKPFQQSVDDHISLKTTSTYEVSLDSRQLVRPLTSDSDPPITGPTQLSSFGNNSNRISPPLVQVKKDIVPIEKDNKNWSRPLITKPEEPVVKDNKESDILISEKIVEPVIESKQSTDSNLIKSESEVVAAKPQEIIPQISPNNIKAEMHTQVIVEVNNKTAPEPPVRTISDLSNNDIIKDDKDKAEKAQPPSVPIRTTGVTDVNKKLTITIEPIKEEETMNVINELESSVSKRNDPISQTYTVTTTTFTNEVMLPAESIVIPMYVPPIFSENLQTAEAQIQDSVTPAEMESECIQEQVKDNVLSERIDFKVNDEPETEVQSTQNTDVSNADTIKIESKLPISKQRSIPSPKIQRPSRVSEKGFPSPKEDRKEFVSGIPVNIAQSPSDKENYQKNKNNIDDSNIDNNLTPNTIIERPSSNFSRFESQEYKVDSKTTFTSVSTVGDSIVKKSTQTEISSMKSTGIPTPKQYKSTTTITTTVKKPADISKSPINSATKIPTGIPRMSSK